MATGAAAVEEALAVGTWLPPNDRTYALVAEGSGYAGDVVTAQRMLQRMGGGGASHDLLRVAYTALMRAYAVQVLVLLA